MNGVEGVPACRNGRFVRMRLASDQPGQVCEVAPDVQVSPGAWYVVRTAEGERLAKATAFEAGPLRPCRERLGGTVVRPATTHDLERDGQLAAVRDNALAYCRRRARELSLPVRPVAASVPLDRETLSITFAAEERVDARELARDVARYARRKVDLKPVGVRDQAKVSGGLGHCGRVLCCTSFMTRFSSVTVRMAKAQNLALNPSRISGMCGRLMCCLAHEAPEPLRPCRGENSN
jgi:cell fate regulator YaaT (PSP1 superfamily)